MCNRANENTPHAISAKMNKPMINPPMKMKLLILPCMVALQTARAADNVEQPAANTRRWDTRFPPCSKRFIATNRTQTKVVQ